jgi:hypothetical protein
MLHVCRRQVTACVEHILWQVYGVAFSLKSSPSPPKVHQLSSFAACMVANHKPLIYPPTTHPFPHLQSSGLSHQSPLLRRRAACPANNKCPPPPSLPPLTLLPLPASSLVQIVVANPKTAGVARWIFLALWGHKMKKGDAAAIDYVTQVGTRANPLPLKCFVE